jgi:hypothetical protein
MNVKMGIGFMLPNPLFYDFHILPLSRLIGLILSKYELIVNMEFFRDEF